MRSREAQFVQKSAKGADARRQTIEEFAKSKRTGVWRRFAHSIWGGALDTVDRFARVL